MKRQLPLAITVVSTVFVLVLIIHFAFTPILYSPSGADSTRSHINPGAMQKFSVERYEKVMPMMQEILDLSGSVVLNMNHNDTNAAERDLREYLDLSHSLDQAVVDLNLSDSELEIWRQENYENRINLTLLVNDTKQLEEIKTLEAQVRSQNSSGDLTTLNFEENSLNQRIRQNALTYRGLPNSSFTSLSKKFDLDTTEFEKNAGNLTVDNQVVEQNPGSIPLNERGVLTFGLSQTSASYGEIINASGTLQNLDGIDQNIEIGVDGAPWSIITPNPDRTYQVSLVMSNLSAGTHIAYARSSIFPAKESEFNIIPSDTVLTIREEEQRDSTNITIAGTLRTVSDIPVTGAPVRISWDSAGRTDVLTNPSGEYHTNITLPPGDHQMKARFESLDLPLNQSESAEISVKAPISAQSIGVEILKYLLMGGIVLLAVGGASRYIHRRRFWLPQVRELPSGDRMMENPIHSEGRITSPWDDLHPDDVIAESQRLFADEQSDAMHHLYQYLVSLAAHVHPRVFIPALTPRELMRLLRHDGGGEDMRSFIDTYEKIRYGGMRLPDKGQEPIISWFQAILSWLGGDHH